MGQVSSSIGMSLACIVAVVLNPGASAAQGAALDPARVRGEWRSLAESLYTIRFTSVESVWDPNTRQARDEHYQFDWAVGGRSALTIDFFTAKGRQRALDLREDGRLSYRLTYARDYPEAVSTMRIDRQKSDGSRFDGVMSRALWVMMPFGMTYDSIIKSSGTIHVSNDKPYEVTLKARENGLQLEAVLTERDGLPRELRVTSTQGQMLINVTEFKMVHGRWFAVAGRGKETFDGPPAGSRSVEFYVRDIAVNEDIPDSRFREPKVPPGVIVIDNVAKKTRIVGGRRAREEWEARHPRPDLHGVAARPIEVEGSVGRTPWGTIFGLISAILGLLALGVHARDSKIRDIIKYK